MSWFENFVTQNLQQKIEMFKSFRHQPTPPPRWFTQFIVKINQTKINVSVDVKNKEMKCNFIRPCAAMFLRVYVIMKLLPLFCVSFQKGNKRKRWRDRLCYTGKGDGRAMCWWSDLWRFLWKNSEKPFNQCVCVGLGNSACAGDGEIFSPSTTENERKKRGALARPLPSVPVCFFLVCQSMTTHAITSKITEKTRV